MKILIAGDLVVNRSYDASKQLDQGVIDLFAQCDYSIVNMEAPVTDSKIRALKTGPNLKAHRESTLDVLKKLKINAVTLANNHIFDFSNQGLADTLSFCKDNSLDTVGAGMSVEDARKTLYIDSPEGKVAFVNFAENEWGAVSETSGGFNPMDIIDNANQIKDARLNAGYVIVIIHGGHEFYNLPSIRMQKQYRFYAEQGADIIVAHHPHCISGYETYKGVPIYYSLGNFLFTLNSKQTDWYKGLLLEIELKEKKITSKLHLIEQEKESFRLSLSLSDTEFKRIDKFSTTISESLELQKSWQEYVKKQSNAYLNYWSPATMIKNRYLQAVFNRLNIRLTNKKGLRLYLNLMRCEAHRDLSNEVIKTKTD